MGLIGAPMVRHHVAQPCERGRQYLVCWHPHAAYTTMALMQKTKLNICTPLPCSVLHQRSA